MEMDLQEKLRILSDAAKYDIACTSSGASRAPVTGKLGRTVAGGICHAFSADGRCVSLLKVLLTNDCAYDCAYCVNRRSNERQRATFTARELAELTCGFYKRNYIEGLFLSSGVLRNPDYTMERMIKALELLRGPYRFNGYIHAKAIPGAALELVERLGRLADRLSVNIELPSRQSLQMLAPQKAEVSVMRPMALIRDGISEAGEARVLARRQGRRSFGRFAPAGQSTQMIIGATAETDLHILRLSSALYQRFSLKRVFFSAYLPVNADPVLPVVANPPLTREHRLYQADWLIRFYGFNVEELVDERHPLLDEQLDPKCVWALAHLDRFPVEVNRAPYEELVRVPGIGVRGARAIVRARKSRTLHKADLARLRISLTRARFFVTIAGVYDPGKVRQAAPGLMSLSALALVDNPAAIRAALLAGQTGAGHGGHARRVTGTSFGQLSLDDEPGFGLGTPVPARAWDLPAGHRRRSEAPDDLEPASGRDAVASAGAGAATSGVARLHAGAAARDDSRAYARFAQLQLAELT